MFRRRLRDAVKDRVAAAGVGVDGEVCTHALAGFLQAVRLGRVPSGSYLIVESLDRLSREKIRPALTLLLNLIESDIKVVQQLPQGAVYDEDVEPMQLIMAVMELFSAYSIVTQFGVEENLRNRKG